MDLTLPSPLAAHFAVKATIGAAELARKLPMDAKTLKRHIAAERLTGLVKGFGRIKPRRAFTEADVARFLAALAGDGETTCQSTAGPTARSGTSTSRSNVVAFSDRLDARTRMMPVPSRKRKKPKPD